MQPIIHPIHISRLERKDQENSSLRNEVIALKSQVQRLKLEKDSVQDHLEEAQKSLHHLQEGMGTLETSSKRDLENLKTKAKGQEKVIGEQANEVDQSAEL